MSVGYAPAEPGSDVAASEVLHCTPFVSLVFDRGVAALVNTRCSIDISRKSLGLNASGREILPRTGTSSRDFEYHEPLLRSLKKR